MPPLWTELFDASRGGLQPWLFSGRRDYLDILTVLIAGLDMKASDSRDKVFALLAFGEETHDIANLPKLVKPDYNKTVSQVYADFTLWWIKEHRSLTILSAVHTLRGRTWMDLSDNHSAYGDDDTEDSKKPSWTLWSTGHDRWKDGSLALKEHCPYRACSDRIVDIELLSTEPTREFRNPPNWYVPAFRGIRVSTIASLQPFCLLNSSEEMKEAYIGIFDPAGTHGTWRNLKRGLRKLITAREERQAQEWQGHLGAP